MEEYSRIVIEEYCRTHRRTKKSAFLWDLVELSYTMECEPEDWEGIQLERLHSPGEKSRIESGARRLK